MYLQLLSTEWAERQLRVQPVPPAAARAASRPAFTCAVLTCLGGGGEGCVSDEQQDVQRGPHHHRGLPALVGSTTRSQDTHRWLSPN